MRFDAQILKDGYTRPDDEEGEEMEDQDQFVKQEKNPSGVDVLSLVSREKSSSEATPRPWRVTYVRWTKDAPVQGFAIRPAVNNPAAVEKRGVPIASIGCAVPDISAAAIYSAEELEANAELIVRAVNSYNSLVKALKCCLQEMRSAADLLEMFPDDYGEAINYADKVLIEADPPYAELDAKIKAAFAAVANPSTQATASPKERNSTTIPDDSPASLPKTPFALPLTSRKSDNGEYYVLDSNNRTVARFSLQKDAEWFVEATQDMD